MLRLLRWVFYLCLVGHTWGNLSFKNWIPFGGLIPTLLNSSGLVSGNSTVYLRILSWSPRPPISEKSTFPGSSFIMLKTMGSTSLGKTLMMVKVVWSRATLAPTTSFDRSILALTPTTFLGPLDDLMMSTFISSNGTFFLIHLFQDLSDDLTNWLEWFKLVVSLCDLFSFVTKLKSF